MTRIRWIALLLFVLVQVVLAASLGLGRGLTRADPPWFGLPAKIGVVYGVQAWCMLPIEVGDLWWAFPARAIEPPPIPIPSWPLSLLHSVGDPYPVPGVLIRSSINQAVFRADSDGSEFAMTAHRQNPKDGVGCL